MTPPTKPPSTGLAKPPPMKLKPRSAALVESIAAINRANSDLPRMRESIFRQFVQRLYDPVKDQFDIPLWTRTFNAQRMPVAITDDADRVLFICPPLTGTVKTIIGGRFSQMAVMADLFHGRDGRLGDNHLANKLTEFQTSIDHMNPREVWRELLIRYGVIKGQSATKAASSEALQDAFLDLDDE